MQDGKVADTVAANIITYSRCNNAFDHTPFAELRLKGDEEFVINKTKMRRGVAITKPDLHGLVKVAPIYTLKQYHSDRFSIDKLMNNEIPGIIYLKESDFNSEGFVSLMESFPVFRKFLEPIRAELTPKGISLLDDNLVMIHDLYSDSK